MRTFKDNADRTWTMALNTWTVKRVRDTLKIDLLTLGDPAGPPEVQLLFRLISDPILLVDVIYVLIKPDADAAGVSDEDFGRAMAGDAIDQATKMLLEEISDFIPNPRDRARARKVIQISWDLIDQAEDILDRQMETELPAQIQQALATYGTSSTKPPASSASTPDPSPSES